MTGVRLTWPHGQRGTVREWRLYPAIVDRWQARGYRTATQVTDPGGTRWEVDVAAFTPELADVRLVEAKVQASRALVNQCLDRLRLAPRVYGAVPVPEADGLVHAADEAGGDATALGVLAVTEEGVEERRTAEPVPERREEGPARVLERALRATLA